MKFATIKFPASFLILSLFISTHAYADEKSTMTCNGEDHGATVTLNDVTDSTYAANNYLIVKLDDEVMRFNKNEIMRNNNYPYSAMVENNQFKIVYYISADQIKKNIEPYKGRLLFMIKKDGEFVKDGFKGFDVLCTLAFSEG